MKKPMLYGSPYIYLEGNKTPYIPPYITEYFSKDELIESNYTLPEYIMIKFRGKGSNIEQAYEVFKMALKLQDWKVNSC